MIASGFGNGLDKPSDDLADPGAAPERAPSTIDDADQHDDIARLRELLRVRDESPAIGAAHARIDALDSAQRDLPQRLPEAAIAALRNEGTSPRIAEAFADPVARALAAAVRNNRQNVIDTLFPVIGPIIRKAIAEALRNLVTNLNSGVESSFTLHGIQWRIEAWRAGVPYAQVVLKHRLSYRIDHVFLIERASGLVLLHESAPDLPELDADAIAGMLTALGDFVGDSVGRGSGETLESLRVGEHVVWVVQGPRANLACFMRGVPPTQLHALLEQRLEEVHAQVADAPSGEPLRAHAMMESWRTSLRPESLVCMPDAPDTSAKKSSRWPLILTALIVAALLAWFIVSRERWNARIDALRAQLAAHPGFVLSGIDAQRWSSVSVHGLLDADADPLDAVLAAAKLGHAATRIDTSGYVSSDDAIVTRRATRLLAPSQGVQLTVKDNVLHLAGHAPAQWIAATRDHAPWIAGVARVESTLTPEVDPRALARAQLDQAMRSLETRSIAFVSGDTPAADADSIADAIAGEVRSERALAATARLDIAFAAFGTTDEGGSDAINTHLRAARAQWLADALAARGIAGVGISTARESAGIARAAHLRASTRELAQ